MKMVQTINMEVRIMQQIHGNQLGQQMAIYIHHGQMEQLYVHHQMVKM